MGQAVTVSIEDLIGSKVVTADGQKIGHVVELEVTRGLEYRVTGLVCGAAGWLARLHLLRPLAHALGWSPAPAVIPWDAVARFAPFTVTLKPGWNRQG